MGVIEQLHYGGSLLRKLIETRTHKCRNGLDMRSLGL